MRRRGARDDLGCSFDQPRERAYLTRNERTPEAPPVYNPHETLAVGRARARGPAAD